MGGKVYRIGDYNLVIMDYAHDHLPEDGSPDRATAEDLEIYCSIEKIGSKAKKEISIKIADLYGVTKYEDGNYGIDWEHDGPRTWLFNSMKEKGLKIEITPILSIHATTDKWKEIPHYYLTSDIGDENIVVTTERRTFDIQRIDEINWLGSRGFEYARPT